MKKENTENPFEHCTVLVLYDDHHTRTRALNASDYLVSQLWERVELDFRWWRTDFLKDPFMAEVATHDAIASDILIVCSRQVGKSPTTLEAWFESWIGKRADREGALIDVTVPGLAGGELPGRQQALQEIARRGNFDYLTTAPAPAAKDVQGTSRLPAASFPSPIGDWLNESRPPSHNGLNE
jgi:hypothetical protein